MLSFEETLCLIRRAKCDDNDAKEELLENNKLLLKSIVRRYLNKGVEFDDLYQLACVGFLKAIKSFDESFETRFTTYVVPMIIGEIKRFLRDDGSIKVSRLIKTQYNKINRYIEEYVKDKGVNPTVAEISKSLDIDQEDVVLALESSRQLVSLYESVDDGVEKGVELIEKIPDGYEEDSLVDKIQLKTAIEKLPDREKKLIILRFYSDKTQSETAKALGISQVQVSRLESKILTNMKANIS